MFVCIYVKSTYKLYINTLKLRLVYILVFIESIYYYNIGTMLLQHIKNRRRLTRVNSMTYKNIYCRLYILLYRFKKKIVDNACMKCIGNRNKKQSKEGEK